MADSMLKAENHDQIMGAIIVLLCLKSILMRYRLCNNQKISLFGYGGWGAGLQGWQNVSEKLARQSIQLAYELGVNLFDTSPLYGRGTSERIFGEELSLVRKNILLSTKFGLVEPKMGASFMICPMKV